MLNHQPFYWKHCKKYITIMGTLLNDIAFVRESNGATKTIKVPVSFGQKDKNLNRLLTNPELRNQWRNYLPRISFEMGSPMYAAERKDNTNNMHVLVDGVKRQMQHPPAPYDIPFTVYIWVPYYEDGLQIVEQILPFFQPEYYLKVTEVPDLKLERDVSVALLGVSQNDMYDGELTEVRITEWQLDFNVKGFFYGPIEERSVIKKVMVNYFDMDAPDDLDQAIVEYSATVNPFDADRDDPHTIIEETKVNNE